VPSSAPTEGEIGNWDEVRVAFDPKLRDSENLGRQPIHRIAPARELLIEAMAT
jgi:hypothetical protein